MSLIVFCSLFLFRIGNMDLKKVVNNVEMGHPLWAAFILALGV